MKCLLERNAISFKYQVDNLTYSDFPEQIEEIDPNYKKVAEVFFGETDANRAQVLSDFQRELSREEESYGLVTPFRNENYCLKMLRSSGKFDAESGMRVVRKFYGHIRNSPQYFSDPCPHRLNDLIRASFFSVLPHRDAKGRRVVVYRPGMWDPSSQDLRDVYCMGFMFAEMLALEPKTQIAGVTLVADMEGFGFTHFRSLTLDDVKNVVAFFQDSYPLWFRVTHVVNAPRIFDLVYSVFKPFLSEDTRESIRFHNSLETFKREVGAEILPEKYRGLQPNPDNSQYQQILLKMKDYFRVTEGHGYPRGEEGKSGQVTGKGS